MHLRLRPRILLFTVLPSIALAVGILWVVNRSVSDQVTRGVEERLELSSMLFEDMLVSRSRTLGVTAAVIASDPRFLSVLELRADSSDPLYRATVAAVARDFAAMSGADLFEVLDRRGGRLASVGSAAAEAQDRAPLLGAALRGRSISGVILASDAPHQVTLTPVISGARVVGVLVLGAPIGEALADQLRRLTRSQVTFVSGRKIVGSTLEVPEDKGRLIQRLMAEGRRETAAPGDRGRDALGVVEIPGAAQTYLTLARRIPGSHTGQDQFYVMQRSLDSETSFLPGIEHNLMALGLLAAIAAMLAGVFLSERITRPVQHLVRGAEEMENGNLDYPLHVHGQDEIAYLTRRFQEMRQSERVYVNNLQGVAQLKADFINVASHELRTPISIMRGYGELFAAGSLGPVSPEQRRALASIAESLDELGRIAEAATRLNEEEAPADTEDEAVSGEEDAADASPEARAPEAVGTGS